MSYAGLRRGRPRKNGKRFRCGQLHDQSEAKPGVGYVYLVKSLDAVKIGYSATPILRLVGLQTGNCDKLRMLKRYELPDSHAREVERSLHRVLRKTNHHIRGEWYCLTPQNAVSLIEATIKFIEKGAA
jgi:hypothetical protein